MKRAARVNYYEHHIGDYDKNTSHLTACEDGIYSRLIRRYYDKERPLDADAAEVKRIARARSKEERAAVDAVLREFFHLEADGWHHDKCDQVIAAYQAGEPEREAKKKNEDTRLARHRQERAELFAVINAAGQHMAWNCPIADLRAAAERIKNGTATLPASIPATPAATAPATPATATQSPIPNPHYPLPTTQDTEKPPKPPRGGRAAIGLLAWIEQARVKGEKPIPEDDPVFVYAGQVGIPREFLRLAWLEFRHQHTQPNAKQQKDWRAHFRNAVRKNWHHLWYLKGDDCELTSVGRQAQRAHEERAAA